MFTMQETLFSASLAVYIATSVIVGVVRWGHRCEPYSKHIDYYYPAWKSIVFSFLSMALMLPAVFMPSDTDAILHVKMMLTLAPPLFSALMMFSYFGKVLKVSWWMRPVYILSSVYCIIVIASLVMVLKPGAQLEGPVYNWFFGVAGVSGILFFISFLIALGMIVRALRRFSEENYSNPEDFPRRFAKGIIWLPIVCVIISWTLSSIGTLPVLSIGLILLSVIYVGFLIGILSPHRAMDVTQLESGEGPAVAVLEYASGFDQSSDDQKDDILSRSQKEEILHTIRHYVEEEQAYLDSHLTLASLSRSCGVNRTYVSKVMNESLGGIFVYVNKCRLAHAARVKEKNPDISVEELAEASGFGSRQSYYNVRRQLGKDA